MLQSCHSVYEQAVILSIIFGALASLSLVLQLWQWLAAWRFPLHERNADLLIGSPGDDRNTPNRSPALQPAVTLLKSLKGCDAATESCLRSWFAQEYSGPMQILFGVVSADDPVCETVSKLIKEFPKLDAQLFVCGPLMGANAKVSKLAQLQKLAKHDVLVISDADVRVPTDFLVNAVSPLGPPMRGEVDRGPGEGISDHHASSPQPSPPLGEEREMSNRTPGEGTREVGLVNCFYRLANPATLAMRWEAIAVNADFWSQVLQSKSLKPLDFALGAVMVTRRRQLEEIGGFESLADCLADDYQLGNRIARKGRSIALCPVVVECWDPPQTWKSVWKHQLRWARTIRVCQPVPYFFSILSNATLWPLLWLIVCPAKLSLVFAAVALLIRMLAAASLQTRLTKSSGHLPFVWLAPIKDLLQTALWLCAFAGNTIEWRGQRFKLRPDGTLEPKR